MKRIQCRALSCRIPEPTSGLIEHLEFSTFPQSTPEKTRAMLSCSTRTFTCCRDSLRSQCEMLQSLMSVTTKGRKLSSRTDDLQLPTQLDAITFSWIVGNVHLEKAPQITYQTPAYTIHPVSCHSHGGLSNSLDLLSSWVLLWCGIQKSGVYHSSAIDWTTWSQMATTSLWGWAWWRHSTPWPNLTVIQFSIFQLNVTKAECRSGSRYWVLFGCYLGPDLSRGTASQNLF